MANTSFTIVNYFDRLQRKAHEIDEKLAQLSNIWKTPHLLIGGYAERTDETDIYLENLMESIRNTRDGLEGLKSTVVPVMEIMDQSLMDLQDLFQNLKEGCDNLGTVLEEFGYRYEERNENHLRIDNQDCINDSLLTTEEMPDMEVEFTPDLTWKCKAKSKESD